MNSSFRSTAAAAAVLLASVGAMMVATPASAQPRAVVVPAPVRAQIERFIVVGPLERGNVARFRLHATPGGEAWVMVPGQPRERLLESRPGVYEGSLVLRGHQDPDLVGRAVANFELRGEHLSARAEVVGDRDDHRAGRDVNPPQITDVTPAQGERVSERGWTRITARIADRGTGVQSVLLRVDGRDVSPRVRVEEDSVRYAEDLPAGRHNAELVVRDRAGNTARRSWSFEVADFHRHDRHDR
jgi:hypothetical protein